MYKLLNTLFGWDYIAWRNSAAQGIARVYKLPDGTTFYWRYKCTKVLDVILTPGQVIWLTCDSTKYIKDSNV
jgi:hypothetical protein